MKIVCDSKVNSSSRSVNRGTDRSVVQSVGGGCTCAVEKCTARKYPASPHCAYDRLLRMIYWFNTANEKVFPKIEDDNEVSGVL